MAKQVGITIPTGDEVDANAVDVSYDDGEPLTPDQLADTMVVLMQDTLGDDPQLTDLLAIQSAMGRALNPA